jgi:hypothetical protein
MIVTIVDKTGGQSTFGRFSDSDLARIATTINIQWSRDVMPSWDGSTVMTVRTGQLLGHDIPCYVVPSYPDAPQAVALHTVDGSSVPAIYVSSMMLTGLFSGPNAMSVAIAHECLELGLDPGCNLWADDGMGSEYARELCDAVQGDSYDIGGVTVPNFLTPAFFIPASEGPWSYLGRRGQETVPGPFITAPSGYQVKRTIEGTQTNVFGYGKFPLLKANFAHSRLARRLKTGIVQRAEYA